MPKSKTRWTAQELNKHYSKPLSKFQSPKKRQIHNIIAKYVKEGKLNANNPQHRKVMRDNAIYKGRGVKTGQVIAGLHPNVPGTVKTSKLGRVESKAYDAANTIPSSYLAGKKFASSGDYIQSGGEHNVMGFSPETKEMIVGYQNRRGKTGVYLYKDVPAKPKRVQHNLMYAIDNKLPMFNESGEKTQGINAEWRKKHRDTFSHGIKVKFPSKKAEVEYIKNLRNADMWDESSVKAHPSVVKSVERWNQKAKEQAAAIKAAREKFEKYNGGNNGK